MDRLHGFFVKCDAKDNFERLSWSFSEALDMKQKTGRLVVKKS